MTKPIIAIHLTKPQLDQLIPEGSEAQAALTKGVIANYASSIAIRVGDRLQAQREQTIKEATQLALNNFQTHSWSTGPVLAKASKDLVQEEVRLQIEKELRVLVAEMCNPALIRAMAQELINHQIRLEMARCGLSGMVSKAVNDEVIKYVSGKIKVSV